jgi:radical SAM protein with 4Fe4S-binding SPASM domain
LCIEPNGDVLPCQSYYVSSGNILLDPWEEIWNSDLLVSFRNREIDPYKHGLPEICWDCPDLPVCGGGCRIEQEARGGIRVSSSAGGGCVGCSGYVKHITDEKSEQIIPWSTQIHSTEGYIPHASQIKTNRRSSGIMPLIDTEKHS